MAVAIKRSRLNRDACTSDERVIKNSLQTCLSEAEAFSDKASGTPVDSVKQDIQARMSESAGIICTAGGVKDALKEARALRARIASDGLKVNSPALVGSAFRWNHMAAVSEAVLTTLNHYISHGGGSRGARAICSPEGTRCPEARNVNLSEFRFIEEQEKDKEEKLIVAPDGDGFAVTPLPVRRAPEVKREIF